MKIQLLTTFTALTAGVLLATSAQADVAGQSSNESYIKVGGTEYAENDNPQDPNPGHTGQIGSPGIGVHTSKTPFKIVSLNRLEWMARFGLGGSHNLFTGVTKIDEDYWNMPTSHNDFGFYTFKKMSAGGTDVYFGEWTDENNINDGSHTVYYVGKDKTNNMPSSGTATYSIQGMNDARNDGLMTGSLTANFGTNRIGGSLANSNLTVSINNNVINPATASFSGAATANGNPGQSSGEFFGNDAKALGGIATFADNKYDTAFAGTKQ